MGGRDPRRCVIHVRLAHPPLPSSSIHHHTLSLFRGEKCLNQEMLQLADSSLKLDVGTPTMPVTLNVITSLRGHYQLLPHL